MPHLFFAARKFQNFIPEIADPVRPFHQGMQLLLGWIMEAPASAICDHACPPAGDVAEPVSASCQGFGLFIKLDYGVQ
jgi:hypothetical protein